MATAANSSTMSLKLFTGGKNASDKDLSSPPSPTRETSTSSSKGWTLSRKKDLKVLPPNPVESPLSPTEASLIKNKLDHLAGSQNPLLGLDLDEPLSPRAQRTSSPIVTSGKNTLFVRKMTIQTDADQKNLADVFPNGNKDAITSAGAENAILLPPAAALWFPPEQWKLRVMDVKKSTFLPVDMNAASDGLSHRAQVAQQELDIIAQTLNQLEDRIRQLVLSMEEQPQNTEKIDKEIRKTREEIQSWELKQWKQSSILDRELHAASKEVEEKDADGKVVKTYTMKDGRQIIVAATKEVLVSLLLEESNADLTFNDTFLLAYVLLMPPIDLLESLYRRYQNSGVKGSSAVLRLFAVLKKWVEIGWVNDFQLEGLEIRFREITNTLIQSLKESGQDSKAVDLEFLSTFISARQKSISHMNMSKRMSMISDSAPDETADATTPSTATFLTLAADADVFATVMAAKELEIYKSLTRKELVDKLMVSSSDQQNAKLVNINHFINWINQMGYWVTGLVISESDVRKRVKLITKLVDIANACTQLKCYNTFFAIITGLSNASIARLNQTWQGIGKKTLVVWHDLEVLSNPQGNYKQYRARENVAEAPFIPFIAMHLRDMLFTHDGNPAKLPNGLYNFAKLRMILERAEKVLLFQKQSFYKVQKGKADSIVTYVESIEKILPMSERDMYKLSCHLEAPAFKPDSATAHARSSSYASSNRLSFIGGLVDKAH